MSSSSGVVIIEKSKFVEMPWKNGKGTTTQMFIDPPNSNVSDPEFHLRVSSAKVVESGPFSSFPNHQRILFLIDGNASLKLNHSIKTTNEEKESTKTQTLNRIDSNGYVFDGNWTTNCELLTNKNEQTSKSNELLDLNVFFNRKHFQLDSSGFVHDGKTTKMNVNENSLLLVFALKQELKIELELKEDQKLHQVLSESSLLISENSRKVTFTSKNGNSEYLFVVLSKLKN